MKFNEYQTSLWLGMLELMKTYRKGELYYTDFIYRLEGLLDVGEYQDNDLIRQWYDYWTPLEILSSTKGDNTTIEDASKYLSEMERFLMDRYISQEYE